MVLIKYSGKHVKIYFNMKITYCIHAHILYIVERERDRIKRNCIDSNLYQAAFLKKKEL